MASNAAQMLDEQIALLEAVYHQTEATITALQALEKKGEALIPISPDCFIPITLKEQKALVAVGGDVLLEKSIDDAIEILKKRKAQIKGNLEKYRALRMKLAERGNSNA